MPPIKLLFLILVAAWSAFLLEACSGNGAKKGDPVVNSGSDTLSGANAGYEENNKDNEDEYVEMIFNDYEPLEQDIEVSDEEIIRAIFDEALLNGRAYALLDYLSNQIGGRLSGSPQAAAAVEWAYQVLDTMNIEHVWKQVVKVPRWVRGSKEIGRVVNSQSLGSFEVPVCALGGSIPTPKEGLVSEIIEVRNFTDLKKLGKDEVKGKIVFFNRRMDRRFINTFYAYGDCADHRYTGAIEAGKMGAIGAVVRSLSISLDDYPHTGSMAYENGITRIPAMAVSTNGAEQLSRLIKEQKDLRFYMKQECETLPDVTSYNVVGEILGSDYPEEIVLVGGHLDSWDLGDGAHDDGAGCVQSIEVLRILGAMGIRPKRTIRAVMFMNEENGLKGAYKYAKLAKDRGENHIAAIETDRGGFAPRSFTVESDDDEKFKQQLAILNSWLPMLDEYGISGIKEGGSGADVGPLKASGTLLFGLVPESQRYFDYHHCAADQFENVNERELHLGAAAMASLVYLISEHGI